MSAPDTRHERDARAVLTGMLASESERGYDIELIVSRAFAIADAMQAERDRRDADATLSVDLGGCENSTPAPALTCTAVERAYLDAARAYSEAHPGSVAEQEAEERMLAALKALCATYAPAVPR